ncbi:MAG: hypothetical protein HOP36_12410 [Methyloglobulus sp.]|nr:hypothetical protein [Methyloglobulus sp.]
MKVFKNQDIKINRKSISSLIFLMLLGFALGMGIAYLTVKEEVLTTKELNFDTDLKDLLNSTTVSDKSSYKGE